MQTRRSLIRHVIPTIIVFMILNGCAAPSSDTENDDMNGMDHTDTTMTDTAGTEAAHDMDAMDQGVAHLATLKGNEFDQEFLDSMIPHHASAVEMAQIATERGQHDEIVAAAHDIISAQNQEISQMTGWLNDWYGQTPSGDDHGMSMSSEVEALRTVPAAEFDAAFLKAMIPHHESAVDMAELVPDRTTRPELTALADSIISTQTAEIAAYQTWLTAWE